MMNTKQIIYNGNRTTAPYPRVYEAIAKVNELFNNEEFYERIAGHPGYDLADISPDTIAALMRKARLNMTVDLYHALDPIRNIDGYDDTRDPSVIHLNIWKIDRPVGSLCNSMVHACVHAVNAFYDRCYFGHGDNSAVRKEHTAPYYIGAIAEQMISKQEVPYMQMEHDTVEPGKNGMDLAAVALEAHA